MSGTPVIPCLRRILSEIAAGRNGTALGFAPDRSIPSTSPPSLQPFRWLRLAGT
jgi:hypothetical protein